MQQKFNRQSDSKQTEKNQKKNMLTWKQANTRISSQVINYD